MVSGYLMVLTATTLHRREPLEKVGNWLRFYMRRFFRISPAYYLSLGLAFGISSLLAGGYRDLARMSGNPMLLSIGSDYSLANFLAHLTYMFGLIPSLASSTMLPDWSLSLEMQFYLILPALYLYLTRNPGVLKVFALTFLALFLSALSKRYQIRHYTEVSLLLYQLPFFLVGIYIFMVSRMPLARLHKYAMAVATVLLLAYALRIKTHHEYIFVLSALFLAFMSMGNSGLGFLARARRLLDRFFEKSFFKFLADTSFSVYLFHGFLISILGSRIQAYLFRLGYGTEETIFAIVLVVGLGSYGVSWLSFRYVETPGIALGKRWLERSKI